ncbi:hypothetical protein [Streptomyces sp. HJ7]
MIRVPHDMHQWPEEQRQRWLADIADSPHTTPGELRIARAAVAAARATANTSNKEGS